MSEEPSAAQAEYDCAQRGHIPAGGRCIKCGEPAELICEVCQEAPAIGVASSGLGAVSLAYCRACAAHAAEPTWIVEHMLATCGSWENVRPDIKEWLHVVRDGEYVLATDAYTEAHVQRLTREAEEAVREYFEREARRPQ